MKTQSEIKTEIFSALYDNTIAGKNVKWLAKPASPVYPLLVYSLIGDSKDYEFQNNNSTSKTILLQVDIYVDSQEIQKMDTLVEEVNTAIENICFRAINGGPEFLDTDSNKIVRSLRWEKIYV